jgi:hypothetical protein
LSVAAGDQGANVVFGYLPGIHDFLFRKEFKQLLQVAAVG